MTDTTLPPEVAEAIQEVTRWFADDQDWAIVRAHLRRLAEENARLARTNIALTAERDHAKLLRLKAEAERDALKARIAEAMAQQWGREEGLFAA